MCFWASVVILALLILKLGWYLCITRPRDQQAIIQARVDGGAAARSGVPAEANPHAARTVDDDKRLEHAWLEGWVAAKGPQAAK